ncbi:MAG: response regulator transcription factor [Gemmatimonadota bacterium]|nr:response regulator transcription factor [Gemmatimonadota bacterium]
MKRILIVEDNPDLAFGLRATLEIEGYAVEVAGDGHRGVEQARALRPDLIILDLMLPGMDGYKVLRVLRESGQETPILILTAKGEEADKVLGFRLGGDDYVTKPFGRLELIARVGALLRRAGNGPPRSPTAAVERFGDVEVHPASRSVFLRGQPVQLTPKEFDLLVALIRRRGAIASRLDLLKEVWGHQAEVMTRTVDIHIAELRRKLEDDVSGGGPRHILTVWKAGYRLVER